MQDPAFQDPQTACFVTIMLLFVFNGLGNPDDVEPGSARFIRQSMGLNSPDNDPKDTNQVDVPSDDLLARWVRKCVPDSEGCPVPARVSVPGSDSYNDSTKWLMTLGVDLVNRFVYDGDLEDIERALPILKRVVAMTTEDDPNCSHRLTVLAGCLKMRYERLGNEEDLNTALSALYSALLLMAEDESVTVTSPTFFTLASAFSMRFDRLSQVEDLNTAIFILETALENCPEGDDKELFVLCSLGTDLIKRFDHVGDMQDLNKAMSLLYRAADGSYGNRQESVVLSSLGLCLQRRFKCLGDVEDIHMAVWANSRALEITPESHPNYAELLNGYGDALRWRYLHLGNPADLEEALCILNTSVNISNVDDPHRYTRLANLGIVHLYRFQHLDVSDDITRSIALLRQAVSLLSQDHPDRAGLQDTLGVALRLETSVLGQSMEVEKMPRRGTARNLSDAEESATENSERCIPALRRDIDALPDHHSLKPARLHNLALALKDRFARSGCVDDLNSAILLLEQAGKLTSDRHYHKPLFLSSLGQAYESRFDALGQLKDIEDAIAMHRRAVELTSSGQEKDKRQRSPSDSSQFHSNRAHGPRALAKLGSALRIRFVQLGELNDLEHAIVAYRSALTLAPNNPYFTPKWINALSICLLDRFERLHDVADLDNAIHVLQSLSDRVHDGRKDPIPLANLGNCLRTRYQLFHNRDDIDRAISAFRTVIELTPNDHLMMARHLTNLAGCLKLSFERTRQSDNLQAAIATFRRAVQLTPKGHPDFAKNLRNLGLALYDRLEYEPNQTNFDETATCLLDVLDMNLGSATLRIATAGLYQKAVSDYSMYSSAEALLEAHSRVLRIFPEYIWLGHGTMQRYKNTHFLDGMVSRAVSAAIRLGALSKAVEWLESGRFVVWSQALSLRTPLDELKSLHPDLANSLESNRLQLQQSGHIAHLEDAAASPTLQDVLPIASPSAADRHRKLVLEYERLLEEVYACPGFENFLRPKELADIIPSGGIDIGYVVFVHVHSDRCDALIVTPTGAIFTVPLPELSLQLAIKMRSQWMKYYSHYAARERASWTQACHTKRATLPHVRVLEYIWLRIVQPILQALKLMDAAPGRKLPHVTWRPTGPLAHLPLHAAGIYDPSKQDAPRVFDYVVSSYTPSLSLALQASKAIQSQPASTPTMLVVAQPETPGCSPLPATIDERDRIQEILGTNGIKSETIDNADATIESVRSAMSRHSWVHMSCHGSQDFSDPTQSAFQLYNGGLSLSDLMSTVADNAELAFLSACQTATGDGQVPDESAHLAAGMLAVGFKGVIGTMWSIMDEDAPVVVEAYYKKLLRVRKGGDLGKGETGAAYALHEAVKCLREKVGEENFDRWVPFVHYGV